MLPRRPDDGVVHVHRSLDVDEDALLDAVTAFAVTADLEIDRRHDGDGLLFLATASGALFKRGDRLRVAITPVDGGHEVEFVAELIASVRRRSDARRRHVVRSGAFAALFAYLGLRGLVDVSVGDFVLLGLSAMFGRRAFRFASKDDDVDELERKIANELNRVCDEAEYS
jgi:hypothetical protein